MCIPFSEVLSKSQVSRCVPEIIPQMDSLLGDSLQQRLCILTINKKPLLKCKLFYPNPLLSSKHRQRFLCFEMATERICSAKMQIKKRTEKSINFECGRCFGKGSRLKRLSFLCPLLSSYLESNMFGDPFLFPPSIFLADFYCRSQGAAG